MPEGVSVSRHSWFVDDIYMQVNIKQEVETLSHDIKSFFGLVNISYK